MMFNPMSKTELTILVSIVVIVAALALRGAWEVAKEAIRLLIPFLIMIEGC